MNEGQALEAACIAHPHDDSFRLILADWLAEHKCGLGEKIARDRTLFTLCRWYNMMNRWEWPSDFFREKPAGFDEMSIDEKHDHVDAPCVLIVTLISERTSLIYHNQIHRGAVLNDEQFEIFWKENFTDHGSYGT